MKNPEKYKVVENRVYKDGRLTGYINQLERQKKPRTTAFAVVNGKLVYEKSGRRVPKKFGYKVDKFGFVENKKGRVVGMSTAHMKKHDLFSFPSFSPEPELRRPLAPVSYFSEKAIEHVDYKEVVETLVPVAPVLENVLEPGILSVSQRSRINYANALNSAVEAGFITDAEAQRYFDYYHNATEKERTQLWQELEQYFEDLGYDYFD